jgi:hypothetical protein
VSANDAPLIVGDAPQPGPGALCGCAGPDEEGASSLLSNAPGLPAIGYRVGTHSSFRQTLIAGLSSATHPELTKLRTRENTDFSIALLDAWASVGDVLTFYQERIANEHYLRTATERFSVVELARLIGYRPRPGVAASTPLAFTLEEARLDRTVPNRSLIIPAGARVQSVPGPGEQAQTFETIETLEAHPDWNSLRPELARERAPRAGDRELYIRGIAGNLKPGDAILIAGDERIENPDDSHWEFRRLTAVEPDTKRDSTRLAWEEPLGASGKRTPPERHPRVFAFRLRASLYGYNAPHPKLLHPDIRKEFSDEYYHLPILALFVGGILSMPSTIGDWKFDIAQEPRPGDAMGRTRALIELDAVHAGVAVGSWLVLSRPQSQALFRVLQLTEAGQARYSVSARRTRVTADTAQDIAGFVNEYRDVAAFAQSEELAFAQTPIVTPVSGSSIVLDRRVEPLSRDRMLLFRGRRPRVRTLVRGAIFQADAPGSAPEALEENSELFAVSMPATLPTQPGHVTLAVLTTPGTAGALIAAEKDIALIAARDDDPTIVESVIVQACTSKANARTRIDLQTPLGQIFDRQSLEILANVAPATHGETVGEILGSGVNSQPRQSFELKQSPLTFVSSGTASGAASTLEVRVDDILWHETESHLTAGATDRTYTTRQTDDAKTVLEFGDGRHGQRLPSGRDNVRAVYRKGIGLAGLVRAGQLTTTLQVPLGVKSVTNPVAATGAADPEALESAQRNAPMTVKTLGRTVSLRDYSDFAMTFAGIDKALATWTWDGFSRRVFLTVAGPSEASLTQGSPQLQHLIQAMQAAGQPTTSFEVRAYTPVHFRTRLKIKVHPDHRQDLVLAGVEKTLRETFSLARREFTQPLALSELITVVQGVEGVLASDVDALYRTSPPSNTPVLHARLPAFGPVRDASGNLRGAEILTLDPAPLDALEVMS